MAEDQVGVAMKLLQGYLWHPRSIPAPGLPAVVGDGFHLLLDEVPAPFAFFENGEPTASQAFYQLTVIEVYPTQPDNDFLHERALLASGALDPLLNATNPSVGWSLNEDLRPA